jgi:hypothetical protein
MISLYNFSKYAPDGKYLNIDPTKRDSPNAMDDSTVVFPRNIYSHPPVPEPDNNSQFIDVSTVYFADSNYVHPLHFSKFGRYNGCPFGYCYGSQSGRNYNLPQYCHETVPNNFWSYWNSKDYDFKEKTPYQ